MEFEYNWKNKSLANLMREYTHLQIDERTNVTKTCTSLLTKPINQYTIENLRLMIGQEFGLKYLIPIAIEKLKEDLFAEGDFYPGDLLNNVLSINTGFWRDNKKLWSELSKLLVNRYDEMINHNIKADKLVSAIVKAL